MNSLENQVGGDHYRKHGALQPWCILREYLTPEELRGYHKGTAIVYLLRERDKGGDEDIRKALHTLQHLVEMTEAPRVLRCLECKHTFAEPEDTEGSTPRPQEDVVCPGCGHRAMRLFYVSVTAPEAPVIDPDAQAWLDSLEASGCTLTFTPGHKKALSDFVVACKQDGNWGPISRAWVKPPEREVHNPAGLTDPGEGYRFAYVDEPRSACSHFWAKSEGWLPVTGTGDELTYRVKL